jgi:hypothetical protein
MGRDVVARNIFKAIEMLHPGKNTAAFEVQQNVVIGIGNLAEHDVAFPPL